jgi:hypothetical protein
LTCRAIPASHKGYSHQGPGKDDIVHGTPKGWTYEKRHQAWPKRNNGIMDWGLRRELHLGSKETFYEATGLEVVKRAVESSIWLRKMSVKTLWRSQPPPKYKKRLVAA